MLKTSFAISAAISAFTISTSAADQTTTQAKDDIPSKIVRLTCPAENAGTLDMIAKSITGRTFNVKVRYSRLEGEGEPERIDTDLEAKPGGSREQVSIDLQNELSDENKVTTEKALKLINPIMRRVCNGSDEDKQRFERWMQENRESFPSR